MYVCICILHSLTHTHTHTRARTNTHAHTLHFPLSNIPTLTPPSHTNAFSVTFAKADYRGDEQIIVTHKSLSRNILTEANPYVLWRPAERGRGFCFEDAERACQRGRRKQGRRRKSSRKRESEDIKRWRKNYKSKVPAN